MWTLGRMFLEAVVYSIRIPRLIPGQEMVPVPGNGLPNELFAVFHTHTDPCIVILYQRGKWLMLRIESFRRRVRTCMALVILLRDAEVTIQQCLIAVAYFVGSTFMDDCAVVEYVDDICRVQCHADVLFHE